MIYWKKKGIGQLEGYSTKREACFPFINFGLIVNRTGSILIPYLVTQSESESKCKVFQRLYSCIFPNYSGVKVFPPFCYSWSCSRRPRLSIPKCALDLYRTSTSPFWVVTKWLQPCFWTLPISNVWDGRHRGVARDQGVLLKWLLALSDTSLSLLCLYYYVKRCEK